MRPNSFHAGAPQQPWQPAIGLLSERLLTARPHAACRPPHLIQRDRHLSDAGRVLAEGGSGSGGAPAGWKQVGWGVMKIGGVWCGEVGWGEGRERGVPSGQGSKAGRQTQRSVTRKPGASCCEPAELERTHTIAHGGSRISFRPQQSSAVQCTASAANAPTNLSISASMCRRPFPAATSAVCRISRVMPSTCSTVTRGGGSVGGVGLETIRQWDKRGAVAMDGSRHSRRLGAGWCDSEEGTGASH